MKKSAILATSTALAGSLFFGQQAFGQQAVEGVTSTQAVLHYQAPGAAACQVKVSSDPSLSPLAADVDPALFTGADQDSRESSLSSRLGTDRYFVVGKRRADLASDGKRYSRALQAFTTYYFQVLCGGTAVQSGQFATANPPLGNNYPATPPFDAGAFGNWAWPTIDWNDTSKTYIDPMTGIALKRATGPGWYGVAQSGKTFGFAMDLNNAWGADLGNILSGTASARATYSGAGNDPIFLALDPAQLTAASGSTFGAWSPTQTLDNLMVRIFGSGSGTIAGCLTDDSGAHCASPPVDVVTLGASVGNPAGTYPTQCAGDTAKGCFPNNGFWGGWNFTPINGQIGAVSGTVNVAGSTVTPAWPPTFNLNWKPGGKIFIAGSSPGCAYNMCTIASVNSSSSLTIVENGGTLAGAAFKTALSGVLLWVKKGSGTVSASISVNFDYAYSDQFTMPLNGTVAQCSSNQTMVSWAADGTTAIPPVPGQLCLGNHQAGPTQVLYLLIPSTGETRLLSPMWFMNPTDAGSDQPADPVAGTIHGLPAAFDVSDPNTFYVQVTTNGGVSLFKGVYNAAVNKFKAYRHSLYAPGSYQPGQDTAQYWYRGPAWADSGIAWTNLTKASQGLDLGTQIAAADSNWDANLFHAPNVTQVSEGRAFALNYVMSNGSPESIALIHSFDLSSGKLTQTADTWSSFPNRWCSLHSNVELAGWYGLICNPFAGGSGLVGNPGVAGLGPYQTTPTAILKNGSFTGDTSMTATAPRDACPPLPSFIQSLAPANPGCVTFQSRMACSLTPYPGESRKWPCEYNPAYSELQPLAPGDGLLVQNTTIIPEFLLIASVTSLGNANYQFTAIRGATANGYQNTQPGWTAFAVPPSITCALPYCTPGVGMWFDGHANSVTWRLDPGAFAAHSDLGNAPTPGANSYCQTNICRFNVPMSQQIGSFNGAFTFQAGNFAGVTGAIALQGYPSIHQFTAPANEQRWMLNYRHINPSFGSGAEVAAPVGTVAYSLVPGTKGVYKFTAINGGLNYKAAPVLGYAGYHLLQEVSSPAKGNTITDATPWKYCVALVAGECQTGSKAGEAYASVPQTTVRADQNCISNWYEDNFPCLFTPPPQAGWAVQQDISRNDPAGVNWRPITMGLSGPGRQFQFGSFIPDPTGTWGFMQGYWLDGVRNDLLIARLPPWPVAQDITTNRANFVTQSVTVGGDGSLPKARVRFGYAENGAPGNFYCTARQDACVASGSPYSFVSENPAWQTCSSGCTIPVPSIPGRVLYFAVDRQDNAGNTVAGDVQVLVSP